MYLHMGMDISWEQTDSSNWYSWGTEEHDLYWRELYSEILQKLWLVST